MDEKAPNFYLLRWRFDFAGGTSVFGMWSQPGDIEQSGAWRQTKAGRGAILRVFVEGKHVVSRITSQLAECDGQDFVMFEWMALARINPFSLRGRGSVIPLTTLAGLTIVSREDFIRVALDGTVTREPRPESHRRTGFATYGK